LFLSCISALFLIATSFSSLLSLNCVVKSPIVAVSIERRDCNPANTDVSMNQEGKIIEIRLEFLIRI